MQSMCSITRPLPARRSDFLAVNGGADIVIASAGISHGTLTEHADDLAVFDAVFATNVNATVATFAPFIATMKTQSTPCRLVGIGSVAGIRGMRGAGAYSACKAALHSYCESLRAGAAPVEHSRGDHRARLHRYPDDP